jgi:hypothetical protein
MVAKHILGNFENDEVSKQRRSRLGDDSGKVERESVGQGNRRNRVAQIQFGKDRNPR